MSENRCVCCGEIIPEGRQVCAYCEEPERFIATMKTKDRTYTIRGSFLQCANWTDMMLHKVGGIIETTIRRAM